MKRIKQLILIIYIIMIPVSYTITSGWLRNYCKYRQWQYGWDAVIINAPMSLFWPVNIAVTFALFKLPLTDTKPPSWL